MGRFPDAPLGKDLLNFFFGDFTYYTVIISANPSSVISPRAPNTIVDSAPTSGVCGNLWERLN